MTKYLKLFPYFGGKFYLLNDLKEVTLPISDKITCFVDVFGGSGTVLLNLFRNQKINRVYNDIDSRLYNLMMTLKDENNINELEREYWLTLKSREYFDYIKNKKEEELTVFEYLYLIGNCFNGNMKGYGIAIKHTRSNRYESTFNNIFKNYKQIHKWNIEHLDFRKLIPKYDSPTTFFYLDPPYLRGGKMYKHSFSIQDFQDLKDILNNIKGYWLMNESEVDFEEITKIFGEPKIVKKYITMVTRNQNFLQKTNNKSTIRKEGYWFNFEYKKDLTLNDLSIF
jgi:DNA adenine methylase